MFPGKIIDKDKMINVKLIYHVRPKGTNLEYNWGKIKNDLLKNGLILSFSQRRTEILAFSIIHVVDFWKGKIKKDPYYFLNDDSKNIFSKKINKLGRRLKISDYE